MNNTMRGKIKEILKNTFTGSNHLGEVYFTEVAAQLEALFKKEREKTLKEVNRIVRDEAHRHNLKVGTSAFGYHYGICSELSKLSELRAKVEGKI